MLYELIHADCRAVLANMGDDSVDSIVTDPPYHLTSIVKRFGGANAAPAQHGTDGAFARASRGFMGQTWDGGDIAFDPTLWAECLRVLKPGGYLLAFSGTRTYHRMACAIDDAGFEIRDMISWLYGSGFPKSHDVSKGIDKAAGAEREVVGQHALPGYATANVAHGAQQRDTLAFAKRSDEPATPEAARWQGWGTALKPACEPICMARKPLIGTVAANVLAHGTGGINIDGCRVPTADDLNGGRYSDNKQGGGGVTYSPTINGRSNNDYEQPAGRFPANVAHDGSDEVVGGFPQTGQSTGGGKANGDKFGGGYAPVGKDVIGFGDSGSAARFFYCAKASKADREQGCENLPGETRGNTHPTVKPTELMRWLVRMVTPPGGLVFDPFTGSGSTGKAAMLEGARFIGAEMTPEYIPIARARIDAAVIQSYQPVPKGI